MTYPEVLTYIFQSFPMYHRIGSAAYKEGLGNIVHLAAMAGNPEQRLIAIHIAGTNGKGSVAHLLSSYFQELGYKTGLYTSPHLIDFRERIKINGKLISEQKVVAFFEKYQAEIFRIAPSFFEMTTILAFDHFANEHVDIAIVEVGLGGRLDATNILSPILSVVTNISLDHTNLLGNILAEIATEKAGIIKTYTPVVIGEYHPETFPVFERIAKQKNAPLFLAEAYTGDLEFGGEYQRKNVGTFLKCVEIFNEMMRRCDDVMIETNAHALLHSAIQNLCRNTGFAGRWQIIAEKPLTICDVAHNAGGIELVMKQLLALPHNHLHIVLGFVNDKNFDVIIPLLPKNATYYTCEAQIERALPVDELSYILRMARLNVVESQLVTDAYNLAKTNAMQNDIIFIGGSFFVVGELLNTLA